MMGKVTVPGVDVFAKMRSALMLLFMLLRLRYQSHGLSTRQ